MSYLQFVQHIWPLFAMATEIISICFIISCALSTADVQMKETAINNIVCMKPDPKTAFNANHPVNLFNLMASCSDDYVRLLLSCTTVQALRHV